MITYDRLYRKPGGGCRSSPPRTPIGPDRRTCSQHSSGMQDMSSDEHTHTVACADLPKLTVPTLSLLALQSPSDSRPERLM